jgi:hypothetical protein
MREQFCTLPWTCLCGHLSATADSHKADMATRIEVYVASPKPLSLLLTSIVLPAKIYEPDLAGTRTVPAKTCFMCTRPLLRDLLPQLRDIDRGKARALASETGGDVVGDRSDLVVGIGVTEGWHR